MEEQMTFWDHLDVLRSSIIRVLVAATVMGFGVFFLKDYLFDVVLWPRCSDFPTYKLLGAEPFQLKLINTELTEQFMIHMKVSLIVGLLVASPYIIYVLFRFISPALYENERRASTRLVVAAYLMFMVGIAVNYFLIFPLTIRFLGTYSVSSDVTTMLTLSSYIDTLLLGSFRHVESLVDVAVPPASHRRHPCHCGHHHTHSGYHDPLDRFTPYLVALRNQHLDCSSH